MPSSIRIPTRPPRSRATAWPGLAACAVMVVTSAAAGVEVERSVLDELASGRARVIVELRLPGGFHPEGTLGENARDAQRRAILAAQQSVLTAIEGAETRLIRRPTTVPFLALEIGPEALTKLETLPDLIVRILSDSTTAAN